MSPDPFLETRIIDDDILIVLLRGALDSTTTEQFGEEIDKCLDDGWSKIIIDGRHLGFLSSMGIGRLITLQTRLRQRGGWVKLASMQGPVADVFRQSGLGKVFEVYGDLEFARESFHDDQTPESGSQRRNLALSITVILVLFVVGAGVVVKLVGSRQHDSTMESVDGAMPAAENVQQSGLDDVPPEEFEKAHYEPMDGPDGLNQVPIANDDTYNAVKDTQLVVSAPGLLANDSDSNPNDVCLVSIVDTTDTLGTVDYWNADGSFAYTPRAGHTGTDTLKYCTTDGELNSTIATVTIEVAEKASSDNMDQPLPNS